MATTVNVNIKANNKVTRPVRKAGREITKLGKTASEAGKKAKGDWGGVGDLFSGLLPRGLQSTLRGFKSTQRQIGRLSKGFKVLKGAIAATGLGLLVVALGEIVANWDAISAAVTSATDETNKQVDLAKQNVEASQAQLDNISATENILKLQGKTEEDILNMRMASTDEAIAAQKILIQGLIDQRNEQVASTQQAFDLTQTLIRAATMPLTLALKAVDLISEGLKTAGIIEEATNLEEAFSGGLARLLFDPEDIAESGDEVIDKANEQLTKLENQRAGYTLRRQQNEEKEQGERDRRDDQARQKEEANEQFLADQILKIRRQAEVDALQDEEKQAIRKRKFQFEDAQAQFKAKGATYDQLLELEDQYERDVDAMREKYRIKREEQAAVDAENEKRKKREDYLEDRQLIMDQLDMEQTVTEQGLSVLSNLNAAFSAGQKKESKKQFQVNKALAVAETLVSTYFSAQKAYQSQLTATPDSPIRAALAAASAIASGLARVAAIKAQKFNAGGSSGGGGGGATRGGSTGPSQQGGAPVPQRLVSPDQMRAYVVQTDLQGSSQAADKMQAQTVL